ncbi:FHA domain-containing protein [Polaromonas sp.]|uniref:FHA domain-containing protein n=1 Tax=Polaromonas sp. TaxID=1869339 RepID=UPI001D66ADBE|nr:FHA domain-containing protein [Polaromonas sp.]MBT9474548.1 FHA domain-containing protein [Polaromonas sp.]
MPKIVVSIDGIVTREVQLTKDRTSLGRRPYNDVVIDNLAVSGEHAVMEMSGSEVHLEDRNSTNGTYVNGHAIKRHLLKDDDIIEIGKYQIRFVSKGAPALVLDTTASEPHIPAPMTVAGPGMGLQAAIKVLSGAAAGREMALVKVVTTIGKPGVAVAAITRRPQGFVVAHVQGSGTLMLNGATVGAEPALLKHGDRLELGGTQMQFLSQRRG